MICIHTHVAGSVMANALEFMEAERKDVGEKGGVALAKMLLTNTTLQKLDLSGNTIHSTKSNSPSKAVVELSRALQVCVCVFVFGNSPL